ncbi:transcriptional regulator with XRE-family HTH domain [Kitasatospora sp. MAA4]|uniref:helix-turn-helix domain-containing protein n=1 Tax=Kitasatospora sp. MAA4 TaxID=3035093 RepID=UPI002475576A|nr:helix-turn-helix transcriptional regulator [Kitasatospora sp. MAA4]MDH6130707.1 transcriptional regulator with XRE-family HTH domain [Kitasatospora sp. MAA4]
MGVEQRPTVRRRVLGTNLRRLREDHGLLLEDAATQLSCHPAKISRIESGKSGIRPLDLKALLDLYGVAATADRDGWLALAREGRHQRWWRTLEDQLPQDFLDLIGLEDEVSECRGFQPGVIPGLFQTEEYATAVIRGGSVGPLDDDQRTKVRVRLERQKVLTREHPAPLNVWMVLGEAALRQQVGGPAVLRNQLLRLIDVAQLPHVTVQVLPFTAGAIMGGPLPFLTYRFPPPSGLDVVLLESLTSHACLEDPQDTASYDSFFNHLRATALSALESEAFIAAVANELPHP